LSHCFSPSFSLSFFLGCRLSLGFQRIYCCFCLFCACVLCVCVTVLRRSFVRKSFTNLFLFFSFFLNIFTGSSSFFFFFVFWFNGLLHFRFGFFFPSSSNCHIFLMDGRHVGGVPTKQKKREQKTPRVSWWVGRILDAMSGVLDQKKKRKEFAVWFSLFFWPYANDDTYTFFLSPFFFCCWRAISVFYARGPDEVDIGECDTTTNKKIRELRDMSCPVDFF